MPTPAGAGNFSFPYIYCLFRERLFLSVDYIEQFADAIQIVPRVVVDINTPLFIGADQRNFRFKRRAQTLYQIFEFRARLRVLFFLFFGEHFGRV